MSAVFISAVLALLALLASAHGQGRGQIYDICLDPVVDPTLQKFSIISPGLGSPQGYGRYHRCHIAYPKTK